MLKHQPIELLEQIDADGDAVDELEVHISYQIIKLFSEGLYQSPHKAVEELVSNSYDAGADCVRIVMNSEYETESLWVVDNGCGMDDKGFRRLWTIAKSEKAGVEEGPRGRRPIGQFGIGKLAAYVLAQHLTHVSKFGDVYRYTTMDFSDVSTRDIEDPAPLSLKLFSTDEDGARRLLGEIRRRDPDVWNSLFGSSSWESWTVAALSGFKDLGKDLQEGRLKWVLRTGLPIAGDFRVVVNGDLLRSSQEERTPLAQYEIGVDDDRAQKMRLTANGNGISIPGIGLVSGIARIYEKPLTTVKAAGQYHRNHGFFVKVRRRVINLHDDLFGLEAQNHAAWSRFYMELDADGLQEYLLSSREGVRGVAAVETLRTYMRQTFLACRKVYEAWKDKDRKDLDIAQLLEDAPSLLVTEPLAAAVQQDLDSGVGFLRIIRTPAGARGVDQPTWVQQFDEDVSERPFTSVVVEEHGPYSEIAQYDAQSRKVAANKEHPYIAKLLEYSKNDKPARLVGSAEVVTEALLYALGVEPDLADEFLDRRDKVLRILAGEYPAAASDALRFLEIANEHEDLMERAVGTALEVLGFEYERRGGKVGGTDGLLTAKLGRVGDVSRTYKVVFDAKTTAKVAVPAEKLKFEALERFREDEGANFGFFIAKGYQGEAELDLAANREARSNRKTLLRLKDLRRLVELQMQFGVTLEELRGLFEEAYDVPTVEEWLGKYEKNLRDPSHRVPLLDLLEALEEIKADEGDEPNVSAARYVRSSLKPFDASRLTAMLKGVEKIVSGRWIEVDEQRKTVRLHQSPRKLVAEVNRVLNMTFPTHRDGAEVKR